MPPTFLSAIAEGGDRVALRLPGSAVVTYCELDDRMTRFAARIGNERKKLIAIEAHSSDQAIVAYLSALRAGHAVAMLPPGTPDVLADFEARFSPDLVFQRTGERWRLTQTDGDSSHLGLHDDLALVLMTSGSSGIPRAVRLSAANLTANANSIGKYLALQPDDSACCILPLHYSYGLSVLNSHMSAGATVCLPGVSVRDPAFLSMLEEAGCTNFAGVPYSYELLEKSGFRKRRFSNLRFMTVAGGRMSADLVRQYNRHMRANGGEFFAMYGQTEATARIAYVPADCLEGNEDGIGVAIPDGELLLLDESGRPVTTSGAEGQLVYTGPNVMMGYGETRKDLARGHELSSLKTGDLAMRDENGLYRITGRINRFSKIAGIRIGHDFLEAALGAQGVQAAVVGDDRIIQVFVCGDFDSDHVCRLLVEASGLTAMQIRVCRMRELPRLSSGKVDYASLRQNVEAEPSGERVSSVEEAFAQVFYPRRVTGRDSFITLGGDSLRFVQLSLELDRLMSAVPEGWENMPVSTLSVGLGKTPARKPMRRSIGIDIFLRAVAILLVVVHHETLWPIPGGSGVMMLLVGYSLARFQSQALFTGRWEALVHPLLQVLVPYFAIVAAYAFAWGRSPGRL
jgi:acyl-CoA synthetase (AMP-forming)/AMP-acid ligase II